MSAPNVDLNPLNSFNPLKQIAPQANTNLNNYVTQQSGGAVNLDPQYSTLGTATNKVAQGQNPLAQTSNFTLKEGYEMDPMTGKPRPIPGYGTTPPSTAPNALASRNMGATARPRSFQNTYMNALQPNTGFALQNTPAPASSRSTNLRGLGV